MELQIILLLLIAFVLGCVAGHWLQGVFARRRIARTPTERRPTKPAAGRQRAARAATSERDDLKLLSGVGPALEKRLHRSGIHRFEQIANWTQAEIAEFDKALNFKGRIEREKWVEQAKILARGGETEFSRKARRAKSGGGKARSPGA